MKNPHYVIASNMRSGTHFLGALINSTRLIDPVKQFDFTPDEMGLPYEDSDIISNFESYYSNICSAQTTGYWGFIIHLRYLNILERWLNMVKISPKEIKWIWLVRRDKIAQSISLLRSRHLRLWHMTDRQKDKIELNNAIVDINSEEVSNWAITFFFGEQAWETFFETYDIKFHKLYYEDFIDKSCWESVVAGILDFLEVPYQLPLDVSTIFKRQGGKDKHQKLYNYLTGIIDKNVRVDEKYLPFEKL